MRPTSHVLRRAISVIVTAAIAVSLLVAITAGPAAADTAPSRLEVGQTLGSGQTLRSPNGNLWLVVQGDGNLVLYDAANRPLWYSHTAGRGTSRLILQGDGNLVLYSATAATWSSNTYGRASTFLALQDDGNLVLYSASGPVWFTSTLVPFGSTGNPNPAIPTPTLTSPSMMSAGQSISAGQSLTSPSGRWTAFMQSDGNLVIYGPWATPRWSSNTAGRTNATLALGNDGGLTITSTQHVVIFSSHTNNGSFLAMQDDGNLVLYNAARSAVWYETPGSPVPPGQLYAGETLTPNESIYAQDGSYRAVQQGDGNLVIYGPLGARWASNTSYSAGATSQLTSDGNLQLTSTDGNVLWSTKTTGSGTRLVMQPDGNLVLYDAGNVALWWSNYSVAAPPGFTASLSQPPASTSRYVRNLSTSISGNATIMQAEGCADAQANPAGSPYLSLLDFGAQVSLGTTWGVQLTVSTIKISDATVVAAVKSYIDGYTGCMATPSYLTVAIGTNNDGDTNALASAGGALWGSDVMNPIIAYAAAKPRVGIMAANDIEPGFNGTMSQAQSWVSGYFGSTSAPFLFFGSADGCPSGTAKTTGTCNYSWTPGGLYRIAFGTAPARSMPLPEIYVTAQAKQWANISLAGATSGSAPVAYVGPLTEVTACAQNGGTCASMSTAAAWSLLLNSVNAYVQTRLTGMLYSTDLRIDR